MSKFEASCSPKIEIIEDCAILREMFVKGDTTEAGTACWHLAQSQRWQCYELLCELLDYPDERKSLEALYKLHLSDFAQEDEALHERLIGTVLSGEVRRALGALVALMQLHHPLPDDVIRFVLQNYYEQMETYSMGAIHQLTDTPENYSCICEMLQSEPYTERKGVNEKRRCMAEFLAERVPEQQAAALITQLASDPYAKIRLCAANLANAHHLEHLTADLRRDPNGHVRRAASAHA